MLSVEQKAQLNATYGRVAGQALADTALADKTGAQQSPQGIEIVEISMADIVKPVAPAPTVATVPASMSDAEIIQARKRALANVVIAAFNLWLASETLVYGSPPYKQRITEFEAQCEILKKWFALAPKTDTKD